MGGPPESRCLLSGHRHFVSGVQRHCGGGRDLGKNHRGKDCSENWEGRERVLWGPAFSPALDRCPGSLAELGAKLSSGPHTLSSRVVGGCVPDRKSIFSQRQLISLMSWGRAAQRGLRRPWAHYFSKIQRTLSFSGFYEATNVSPTPTPRGHSADGQTAC